MGKVSFDLTSITKGMIFQFLVALNPKKYVSALVNMESGHLVVGVVDKTLTEEQKIRKIGNMLSALKKKGTIILTEKKKWVLVEV